MRSICVFAVATVLMSCVSDAQQDVPEGWKPAIEVINQRSVEGTVSFLASDEMKGRDTPSPELNVAGAYVAARFKAAGLEGIGDEGTYFQTTKVATSQVPTSGIFVETQGEPVKVFGMLSASPEALVAEGVKVTALTGDEPKDMKFSGPVSIVLEPFKNSRAARSFSLKLSRLRSNGATAILVQVDPGHKILESIQTASRPRLIRTRGPAGHVVVIEKADLSGPVSLTLPAQINAEAEVRNVMGVLKGSDPKMAGEAIIVSAHLDHIGESGSGEDTINNGADDNATGVTAVVTLADAFGSLKKRPKRSIIFMTFWGEEKGLLGSRYYANNPTWDLAKVVANVNIEMIGRPEPGGNAKAWVTGWGRSTLGELMNVGSQKMGVLIFQHPQFSGDMLYRASDNAPFADKGVIAHSFSAGSLHADYHKPTDEVDRLELRHMTRVIQGLFGGCHHLAEGATPKKSN